MATFDNVTVEKDYTLTVVADAFCAGNITEMNGAGQPVGYTAFIAGSTTVIGPNSTDVPKVYRISTNGGTYVTTKTYDTDGQVEDFDAVAFSGDYTDLTIEPEDNVPSPTAIAENDLKDAIDGILAILIAKGLMADEA